jgi:hypothetical protein
MALEQLHVLIQTAMGWTNSHLHQFEVAGSRYADSQYMRDDFGAIDCSGLRVSDLVAKHGAKQRFGYEYDFRRTLQRSDGSRVSLRRRS